MNTRSTVGRLVLAGVLGLAGSPAQAGFSGSDVFVPMAGSQAGVGTSYWYTTLWIHNPATEAATARIYFLERGTSNPSPPWVDVLIAAGDTEKLDDIVGTLFHVQKFGALRVTCATARLLVTARVYSNASGPGELESVGQDFAAVPASFAIGLHETSSVLGVHQTIPTADSECRHNFGFVETTGHSATVRVTSYDGDGNDEGSKDFTVLALSQRQVAYKDHFDGVSAENSRLEFEVIAGEGRVVAYGSMIANGTDDPTTFEMEYPVRVLADGAASGISGVDAGAGLTGGGSAGTVTLDVGAGDGVAVSANAVSIADLGVTAAKLADSAVTGAKIANGTVASDDVGFNFAGSASKGGAAADLTCTDCIGAGEIASGAVGSEEVANGSITSADIATDAVDSAEIATGAVGAAEIASGAVGSDEIANGSITSSDIAANAVGSSEIAAGAVGSSELLPFSGSTSGADAFFVTNSGSGRAIRGTAGTDTAIWGVTSSGIAGVDGWAAAGGSCGTRGRTSSGTGFGVCGVNAANGNEATLAGQDAAVWATGGIYDSFALLGCNAAAVAAYRGSGSKAGYFDGSVEVHGTLTKTGGSFRIDHPLDPAGKYLSH